MPRLPCFLPVMSRWLDIGAWAVDRFVWSLHQRGALGTAGRLVRGIRTRVCLPERAADADAVYRRFVRRRGTDRRGGARLREMLNRLTEYPLVSLIAYLETDGDLDGTLRSLAAQIYPHWELVLVAESAAGEAVREATRDLRVRAELTGGRAGALARGLAVSQGTLVAAVSPGDELAPEALLEVVARFSAQPELDVVYTDEDRLDDAGCRSAPRFKPDWAPDLLDSIDYVGRLAVFRRCALGPAGGSAGLLEGAEEYDALLHATELGRVGHVARVLYHARTERPIDDEAACEALRCSLRRRGRVGSVTAQHPGVRRVQAKIAGAPLVSLIVPTRDGASLLRGLVESVERRSSYRRFELVVVDNGSIDPAARRYLAELETRWRVLRDPRPFNWSALNNAGASAASGDLLLFVNNDVQVVSEGWLEAMMQEALRPEVGVVGARLLYEDRTIQHAGIVVGLGGIAGHAFRHLPAGTAEPLGGGAVTRDWSAVTGACMMVRREVFRALGGFDERLAVAYNDVDFCLRARSCGFLVVYTPWATLLHLESATRWRVDPRHDRRLFRDRWAGVLRAGDPYYNPNLSLEVGDWRPA